MLVLLIKILFYVFMLMDNTLSQSAIDACAMESCSPQHDGWTTYVFPTGNSVKLLWSYKQSYDYLVQDIDHSGSCSSNGDLTICTFNQSNGAVALDTNGSVLWSNNIVHGNPLFTINYIPVIDNSGYSSILDGSTLVYLTDEGELCWYNDLKKYSKGSSFNLGATTNGFLPTIFGNGVFGIYECTVGLCWASMQLGLNWTTGVWFVPTATVATVDARVYIPTTIQNGSNISNLSSSQGALFCVLATKNGAYRLQVQWSWPYTPVPGQAPTTVINSDNSILIMFFGANPQKSNSVFIYALHDPVKSNMTPTLLWSKQIGVSSLGILVERETGAWVYDIITNSLLLLDLSQGNTIRTINLTPQGVIGPPISFGTLGVSANGNIILIACFKISKQTNKSKKMTDIDGIVSAIDLTIGKLLWTFEDTTTGQIVPVLHEKNPRMVFKNNRGIVKAIG